MGLRSSDPRRPRRKRPNAGSQDALTEKWAANSLLRGQEPVAWRRSPLRELLGALCGGTKQGLATRRGQRWRWAFEDQAGRAVEVAEPVIEIGHFELRGFRRHQAVYALCQEGEQPCRPKPSLARA